MDFVYVMYFGEQSQLDKSGQDSPPILPLTRSLSQWGVCGVVDKRLERCRSTPTANY